MPGRPRSPAPLGAGFRPRIHPFVRSEWEVPEPRSLGSGAWERGFDPIYTLLFGANGKCLSPAPERLRYAARSLLQKSPTKETYILHKRPIFLTNSLVKSHRGLFDECNSHRVHRDLQRSLFDSGLSLSVLAYTFHKACSTNNSLIYVVS